MTAEFELDPAATRRQQRLVLGVAAVYAVIGIMVLGAFAAVVIWAVFGGRP